ncbi:MAG: AAA family ATPase [Chloroflexi bacterium]|nr:AAA family ATPase [Chloroflexota bacterium]
MAFVPPHTHPPAGFVMACPTCGTACAPAARFCGVCGARLLVFCWSCGSAAALGQAFCEHCGSQIVAPGDLVSVRPPSVVGQPAADATLPPAAPATNARSNPPDDAPSAASTESVPTDVTVPTAPTSTRAISSPAALGPRVGAAMSASTTSAPLTTPPATEAPLATEPPSTGGGSFAASDALDAWAWPLTPGEAENGRTNLAAPDNGRGLLVEERRIVTVLFADIVGYTTLAERLDPEDVREILARVFGRLAESVALYGGTIDKFMGDAVLALFGAPTAHEDDPVRATHAGLAMLQSMASLDLTDRDGNPLQLQLRVGVNTGEVIAGAREIGGHREYSVFGDAVNVASRLQTAAAPGTVLLGELTARHAGSVFDLEPTGALLLRGKAEPVPAFRVRGTLVSRHGATAGLGAAVRVPLVGRLAELRRLRETVQEVSRGRGQLAAVIGEHGLGKTRLLAELRGHAEELGIRWVETAAPSFGQGLSYRLMREMLAEIFGLTAEESDEQVLARVHAVLDGLGLGPMSPWLGVILGVEAEADVPGLTAAQVQRRALKAVREVLRGLSRERPLALVLDALQWADPTSVDLLSELMSLTDEAPILFSYVFTPDPDAPSWQLKELAARAYPHRYAEVTLGPLSERAARELLCSLLACADAPASVEELVLSRADGNPYFIEEVVRALIDGGALRSEGDRWVADRDIREIQIPETLLATVTARIDRLPESVRRTLQVAAVIGRQFSERVLRRVLDTSPNLDRQLREAQRAGLIREETVIPERRFVFAQALIQEAALSSLLLRRRREIHVQVGWALEEIYASALEEQYGDLARHFAEGEAWERTFRYSRLAAEQAAAAYANDEAVTYFTIALDSAERSAAGADPEVVALLRERRGDIQALLGAYREAVDDFHAALDHHLSSVQDASEGSQQAAVEARHVGILALKVSRYHSYQGQVADTRAALDLALRYLPPDSPDLSSVWSLQATVHTWATEMAKAAEAGRKALAIAEQHGTPMHLAKAFEALTVPSLVGALGHEITELADRWVALAREAQEQRPLVQALASRALLYVWGLWTFDKRLRQDVEEALELARSIGSLSAEHTARGILGAGRVLLGEWVEGEADLQASAGQTTTLLGAGAIFEWWLLLLLTLRGDLEPAAERMRGLLDDRGNTHRLITMSALLALNRRFAGDEDGCIAALAAAEEASSHLGCAHCDVTFEAIAAELLAEAGDETAARHHIARARELGAQFGRRVTSLAADRAEAHLTLRDGDAVTAVAILESAADLATQIGQPYEVGATTALLGHAYRMRGQDGDETRSQQALEGALAVFERLGAAPAAERIRSATGALLPA